MAVKLPMGQKELRRGKLLEMVKQGKMTLKAVVRQLKISYRQGIRLYRSYRDRGDAGLLHGSRGNPSNRRTAVDIRGRVVELYRRRYPDFGPTFAAEKLAEEDGVNISVSTLRWLLIEEGLGHGKRRSREYRSLREPRSRFGELVQCDGSPPIGLSAAGRAVVLSP